MHSGVERHDGRDDLADRLVFVKVLVDPVALVTRRRQRAFACFAQRHEVSMGVAHNQTGVVKRIQSTPGLGIFADRDHTETTRPKGAVGMRRRHGRGGKLSSFRADTDVPAVYASPICHRQRVVVDGMESVLKACLQVVDLSLPMRRKSQLRPEKEDAGFRCFVERNRERDEIGDPTSVQTLAIRAQADGTRFDQGRFVVNEDT